MRTPHPTCMWSFRTIGSILWCVEQDQDCGQSHRQTDNVNTIEYLRELIPPTVGERQPYNLRSNRNITHVLARRQGLSRSFFPTVIREWNSLPVEIRLAETLHGFSKSLDALYPSLLKRSWFSMWERFINIHHSRIRLGCSKLKAHLHFELHVEDSPHCACDQVNEDPYHYFFVCPFYKVQRVQMMNDLSQYITGIPRLSHILYGNDALSETYNKYIFIIVHKFIKDTERFKN